MKLTIEIKIGIKNLSYKMHRIQRSLAITKIC